MVGSGDRKDLVSRMNVVALEITSSSVRYSDEQTYLLALAAIFFTICNTNFLSLSLRPEE